MSRPVPHGHVVLVRVPAGTRVLCDLPYEGRTQDITGWFADLVLIGLADRQEAAASGRPEPADTVEAFVLRYDPPTAGERVTVTYAHPASGEAVEFDPQLALRVAGAGIGVQVTAGVAERVAAEDLPEDLSGLSGPG